MQEQNKQNKQNKQNQSSNSGALIKPQEIVQMCIRTYG